MADRDRENGVQGSFMSNTHTHIHYMYIIYTVMYMGVYIIHSDYSLV